MVCIMLLSDAVFNREEQAALAFSKTMLEVSGAEIVVTDPCTCGSRAHILCSSCLLKNKQQNTRLSPCCATRPLLLWYMGDKYFK